MTTTAPTRAPIDDSECKVKWCDEFGIHQTHRHYLRSVTTSLTIISINVVLRPNQTKREVELGIGQSVIRMPMESAKAVGLALLDSVRRYG